MIIEVHDVRRHFTTAKKRPGMQGALNLLINREKVTFEALKGVSFSLEEGTFNGLIGSNGAGKTTLLKILSGLIPCSQGRVRVAGHDPFLRSVAFRKQIALVMGQKAQLWWDLPGRDAFELLKEIYEIPSALYRERLHTLAELLDVQKHLDTQIRRLSLGERMKMELIGALLHWPKVIFLDEPTIGLDVSAAHRLREFLRTFNQKERATIILTSHNMEDIERLCSRVIILRKGELIFDGTADRLISPDQRQLRVTLQKREADSAPLPSREELGRLLELAPEHLSFVEEASSEQALAVVIRLHTDAVAHILQRLLSRFAVNQLGIEEPSLENVIQDLFDESRREDQR